MPIPARTLLLAALAGPAAADDAPPAVAPAAVTIVGRLIDRDGNRPVAGAEVAVTRAAPAGVAPAPSWVGTTAARTDADGRYALTFPPDQVAAAASILVTMRVDHPDFVPLQRQQAWLQQLLGQCQAAPTPPGLAVPMDRGEVCSARVLNPDGSPAADVPFIIQGWYQRPNDPLGLYPVFDGRTDAAGWVRRRMMPMKWLILQLTPERAAPYRHYWGPEQQPTNESDDIPLDLGEIRLGSGAALAGRVLDEGGRPVVGRKLEARGLVTAFRREATTDAEGRFAFAPLGPGNYLVSAVEQDGIGNPQPPAPAAVSLVLRPRPVFWAEGEEPPPLELREAPTVRVAVRFVDSAGKPTPGVPVTLGGIFAPVPEDAVPPDPDAWNGNGWAAANLPERRIAAGNLSWMARVAPDAAGRVEFRAPRGGLNAYYRADQPDPATAFRSRPRPGEPLQDWGHGRVGPLDADHPGVEVIAYRAPVIEFRITTEDGEPVPADAAAHVGWGTGNNARWSWFNRDPDGRFLSRSLLPDREYTLAAWGQTHVQAELRHANPPEWGRVAVELTLRRRAMPLMAGDFAPPFLFETDDGRDRQLADYRGRHLLLHAWSPENQPGPELARLDAVQARAGADRLALLGLALTDDADAARREVAVRKLAWPQAILRDGWADPMFLTFGQIGYPTTLLIGPDGRVLALNLQGEAVDQAVAQFLGVPLK